MFSSTPPVVKNLLIINVVMFLLTMVGDNMGFNVTDLLGLHHWSSDLFRPHQFVSYMFMHGGLTHIFFNMFALWMFGRVLEQVWGSRRFLIYYMVTGIGAAFLQMIVVSFQLNAMEDAVQDIMNSGTPAAFADFINEYVPKYLYPNFNDILASWSVDGTSGRPMQAAISICHEFIELRRNISTVGASGSVFGILLAFGMLFPNTELLLIFPPIPIKAKYFVIGYGLIELYSGFVSNPSDNVAHFAHLGGMLFGYFMIRYWKKRTQNFY